MSTSCIISKEEMAAALVGLRAAGVLSGEMADEQIDRCALSEYVKRAVKHLPPADKVAILCLSGMCVCGNEEG